MGGILLGRAIWESLTPVQERASQTFVWRLSQRKSRAVWNFPLCHLFQIHTMCSVTTDIWRVEQHVKIHNFTLNEYFLAKINSLREQRNLCKPTGHRRPGTKGPTRVFQCFCHSWCDKVVMEWWQGTLRRALESHHGTNEICAVYTKPCRKRANMSLEGSNLRT